MDKGKGSQHVVRQQQQKGVGEGEGIKSTEQDKVSCLFLISASLPGTT